MPRGGEKGIWQIPRTAADRMEDPVDGEFGGSG